MKKKLWVALAAALALALIWCGAAMAADAVSDTIEYDGVTYTLTISDLYCTGKDTVRHDSSPASNVSFSGLTVQHVYPGAVNVYYSLRYSCSLCGKNNYRFPEGRAWTYNFDGGCEGTTQSYTKGDDNAQATFKMVRSMQYDHSYALDSTLLNHYCKNVGCEKGSSSPCTGDATCTEKGTCTVCNQEYGPLRHNWSNSNGTHSCSRDNCDQQNIPCSGGQCGSSATCAECGGAYNQPHVGNWQVGTEDHWRFCSICEHAKADYGYHQVVSAKPVIQLDEGAPELYVEIECSVCGTNRAFAGGISPLDVTNRTTDDQTNLTTGTCTKTVQVGETERELTWEVSYPRCTFGGHTYAPNEDGTTHTCKYSAVCGKTAAIDCTGGEATCGTGSACECGRTLGGALGHDFDPNGNGTHSCSRSDECGAAGISCSGGQATCQTLAVCSDCSTAYGSKADHDFDSNENGTHSCASDPACPLTDIDCFGGENTCESAAKCEDCGDTYGSPTGHDFKPNWNGTHSCENDGCDQQQVKCGSSKHSILWSSKCPDCGAYSSHMEKPEEPEKPGWPGVPSRPNRPGSPDHPITPSKPSYGTGDLLSDLLNSMTYYRDFISQSGRWQ